MVGSGRLAFACPDVLAVLVDVTAVGGSVANLCQAALEVAALHELGRYHDLTVRVHIAPPVAQFHTGFAPRSCWLPGGPLGYKTAGGLQIVRCG